ncbi:acyl-CoA synthetase [Streptomyces sp. RM1]
MTGDDRALMWPRYQDPDDLAVIEQIPLAERGLPVSTWQLVDQAARRWPERPALRVLPSAAAWQTPVTLSFDGLRSRVIRQAAALVRLGVTRGDAVGVISANTAGVICALLAAQAAGGVAAPVNPALSEDRIRALVEAAGSRVLIAAGPELADPVWQMVLRLAPAAGVKTVLVLRPDDAKAPPPELPSIDGLHLAYLDEPAAAEDDRHLPVPEPVGTDAAAYFHTGGTTGAPKLAVHTHANEVAMAWSLAVHPTSAGQGAVFAALPLFHVNAVLVTCLAPLLTGRTVVWAPPLGYRDPGLYPVFWRIVERYRIASMSAVPTVYATLAQLPVGGADISSLKVPVVGAAPLPEAVRQAFAARTGIELVEGYGMTEATCASAATLPGHARAGSVGQRLPYQRIKAVAVDERTGAWRDLPPGEPGLLVVSGPVVFEGYLRDGKPDRDGVVREGWLDTGDHGSVDGHGFVRLRGRLKDLIIRGGHNIDPAVIEETLLAHPDVSAAAAVGRPDAHAGEVPVAYVTLHPGAVTGPDDLCAWAAERVPEGAAAPKQVQVIAQLPVTEVGKVFKPALRQDATRRHIATVLAALEGARLAEADGSGVLHVLAPAAQLPQVHQLLGRYTIDYRTSAEESAS